MRTLWSSFVLACSLAAGTSCQAQINDIATAGAINFQFKTLHLKNDKIFAIERVTDESGEPEQVTVQYNVMIPFNKDGVTLMRKETRTRTQMRKPMINRLIEIEDTKFEFLNCESEVVSRKDALEWLPKNRNRVIILEDAKVPPTWRDFLRANVLILRPRDLGK